MRTPQDIPYNVVDGQPSATAIRESIRVASLLSVGFRSRESNSSASPLAHTFLRPLPPQLLARSPPVATLPRFPRPSSFSALSIEARKPARPHTSGTRTLSALVVPRFPDSQATSIGFVLPNPDSLPRPSRGLGWAGNGRSCRFFRAASSGRGAAAR